MAASWTPVWRVPNEGTSVDAYEASTSRNGNVTVRLLPNGGRQRQDSFWFNRFFGATPEAAIEKFLAVQAQRLARLEQDRAEIQQQAVNALALRAARQQEATH